MKVYNIISLLHTEQDCFRIRLHPKKFKSKLYFNAKYCYFVNIQKLLPTQCFLKVLLHSDNKRRSIYYIYRGGPKVGNTKYLP